MSATAVPSPSPPPTYSAAEHLLLQHRLGTAVMGKMDGFAAGYVTDTPPCPACTAAFAAAESGQFCASRLCPVGLQLLKAAMKVAAARRAARMGVAL